MSVTDGNHEEERDRHIYDPLGITVRPTPFNLESHNYSRRLPALA